jgi:hypothetical protein
MFDTVVNGVQPKGKKRTGTITVFQLVAIHTGLSFFTSPSEQVPRRYVLSVWKITSLGLTDNR